MFTKYNPITPGVEHFLCDTVSDIQNISVVDILPGSKVFVIADSVTYMLNHQKQWIPLANNSSGDSSGGTPTEGDYRVDGGVIL